MKKVLVVLGVAAFSLGIMSCKKQCECTTYALGMEMSKITYEIKGSEDCAQFITYVDITKTGVKCNKK
jgi:hypothetical protein